MRTFIALMACTLAASAAAAADDPMTGEFARSKYVLFCAGCHGYEGEGGGGGGGTPKVSAFVPRVGALLRDPEGRRYLLNVGGVTSAGMSDREAAIVLNYVLRAFGGDSLPADFTPYTAAEVAAERQRPVADPVTMQKGIRTRLRAQNVAVPDYQWEP